jgi:hypothetical protein
MLCHTCPQPATVIFNDDTLACDDCKEARFDDKFHLETEDDLWWPLRQVGTIAA